jgi:hypothetical protein
MPKCKKTKHGDRADAFIVDSRDRDENCDILELLNMECGTDESRTRSSSSSSSCNEPSLSTPQRALPPAPKPAATGPNTAKKKADSDATHTVSLLDRVVLSVIVTHGPTLQLTRKITRSTIEALIPLPCDAMELNVKCKERYNANRTFLVDRLSTAFGGCEHTLLQVLSTVEKAWPAVSNAGLASLRSLAHLPAVTPEQVRKCLEAEFFGLSDHCTEKQKTNLNRVVSCLFYTPIGGEAPKYIPGQFILDVLNALRDGDVDDESLAEDFAAHQVATRRAVSSLLFYVYILCVLASLIVSMRVWDAYVLGSATAPTSNWMNYCENGPTSECHFNTRTFASISDREGALRFLRTELPTMLWANANGGPASSVPFGAAWFIGALSIRVAPTVGTAAPFSCVHLNLSKTYSLAVTSQTYDCSGASYATIPFSFTAAEARASLANFTIGSPFQDVTVIAAYALFMPSNGYTVFHEAALTFLQTGSVVSRARVHVFSHHEERHQRRVYHAHGLCFLR